MTTQNGLVSFPETHFFNKIFYPIFKSRFQNLTKKELIEIKNITNKMDDVYFPLKFQQFLNAKNYNSNLSLKDIFEMFVLFNLDEQDDINISKAKWVEKTPAHINHIDTILQYYPKSKIVVIFRNPLDSICSAIYNFDNGNISKYLYWIKRWNYCISLMEKFKKKHPQNIFCIKYENIKKDKMLEMKKLFSFLKIDFKYHLLENSHKEAKKLIVDHEVWKKSNFKNNFKHKRRTPSLYYFLIIAINLMTMKNRKKYNF